LYDPPATTNIVSKGTPVKVEVSRFNASIFELVHREKNERAFLRREDPEFNEAIQVEAAHQSKLKKLKKMPFGLARLVSEPTIEITDERWRKLRERISGSFPVMKIGP